MIKPNKWEERLNVCAVSIDDLWLVLGQDGTQIASFRSYLEIIRLLEYLD